MAQPGQRIGEYLLDQRVGSGAFGEVWRAHHHVWSDQIVAVKIPADAQYLRNLQREGAAIHTLEHPNIVKGIAFDPFAETPYLAMEYVPGTSLRPLISPKSLGPGGAIAIMKQVLAGLKCAHDKGIIHRDIKPENILIHERASREGYASPGAVKVTDFGLGRTAGGVENSIVLSASLNGSAAREIAGTVDYMAPEQRRGESVDARADIYSCGVVLFEMLTGERPAGTEVPSALNPAAGPMLDDIFRRSYARLEKRFSSADEFLSALSKVQGVGVTRPPPLPFQPMPHRPMSIPPPLPRRTCVQAPRCPKCHMPFDSGDQFCMHCGMQLVAAVRRCGRCGAFPDVNDDYCIFCGDTLSTRRISVERN